MKTKDQPRNTPNTRKRISESHAQRFPDRCAPFRVFSVFRGWLLFLVVGCLCQTARAQWLTESVLLQPGWNAVYLHVAPDSPELTAAISGYNDIQEIWLWKSVVFPGSPDEPTASSRWIHWKRGDSSSDQLSSLIGNAAYLVRVTKGVNAFNWSVKGRPLPPSYQWTTTDLNFIGFPGVKQSPQDFSTFLSQRPGGLGTLEVYSYSDGNVNNRYSTSPNRVFGDTPVSRGRAYWLKGGGFNRYYGPFELVLPGTKGFEFGDATGQQRMYLRNATAVPITVHAQLIASENSPLAPGTAIPQPPVIVRGELDPASLTYGVSHFLSAPNQTLSFDLQPRETDGAVKEIILGINRQVMGESPATDGFHAGILRFTDSLGHTEVNIPISAYKENRRGLWVGDALITEVRHNVLQKAVAAE